MVSGESTHTSETEVNYQQSKNAKHIVSLIVSQYIF